MNMKCSPTTPIQGQRALIADGYLAATLLMVIPGAVGFFGQLASLVNRQFGLPVGILTAVLLYASAVRFAISGIQKPPAGSRLASIFTLIGAALLPLIAHRLF